MHKLKDPNFIINPSTKSASRENQMNKANGETASGDDFQSVAFQMSGRKNPNNTWVENKQMGPDCIFEDSECLEIYEQSLLTSVSETVAAVVEDECVCDSTVRNALARGKLFYEAGGL